MTPELAIIGIIVGFLGGGVMGAIIAHFASKCRDAENDKRVLERERQNRKRRFLGKLNLWTIRFQRSNQSDIQNIYGTFATEFPYESGLIELDFTNREEFVRLAHVSFSFKRSDIEEPGHQQARDKILHAIAAMKQFVESA